MDTKARTILLVCVLSIVFLLPSDSDCLIWPRRKEAWHRTKEAYRTRWDKVNLDEVLQSKRLLHYHFNCLMSVGPCPPDGRELKRILPEALETECAKCSKSQKEGAIYVIKWLREYEPKQLQILANRYDPDGKYRRRYLNTTCIYNNTI